MISFATQFEEVSPELGGGKQTQSHTITIHNHDSFIRIKQLFSRALNTWADAHPELKELSDIMEHGKAQQNYYEQRSDIKLKIPTGDMLDQNDC